MSNKLLCFISVLALAALILAACGSTKPTATPAVVQEAPSPEQCWKNAEAVLRSYGADGKHNNLPKLVTRLIEGATLLIIAEALGVPTEGLIVQKAVENFRALGYEVDDVGNGWYRIEAERKKICPAEDEITVDSVIDFSEGEELYQLNEPLFITVGGSGAVVPALEQEP